MQCRFMKNRRSNQKARNSVNFLDNSCFSVPVPSMPRNVRANYISNTTVQLGWERPINPRGVVLGYRVYFMKHNNFTDVVTVKMSGRRNQYTIVGLGSKTFFFSLSKSRALLTPSESAAAALLYTSLSYVAMMSVRHTFYREYQRRSVKRRTFLPQICVISFALLLFFKAIPLLFLSSSILYIDSGLLQC